MALSKTPAKAPAKPVPAAKTAAAKAPPGKTAAPAKAAAAAPAKSAPAAPPTKTVAPTVTLKHLAAKLGDSHDMPKKQAEAVMSDIVDLMIDHLKSGDRLRIGGLGILEVKHRAARTGRNPATGATIQIAASRKIAFRPAKELKDAI